MGASSVFIPNLMANWFTLPIGLWAVWMFQQEKGAGQEMGISDTSLIRKDTTINKVVVFEDKQLKLFDYEKGEVELIADNIIF